MLLFANCYLLPAIGLFRAFCLCYCLCFLCWPARFLFLFSYLDKQIRIMLEAAYTSTAAGPVVHKNRKVASTRSA